MRMKTVAWLGMKHVGVDQPAEFHNDSCDKLLKTLVDYWFQTGLKKRFHFVIAATEDECRKGLNERVETIAPEKRAKLTEGEELLATIRAEYGSADDGEGD